MVVGGRVSPFECLSLSVSDEGGLWTGQQAVAKEVQKDMFPTLQPYLSYMTSSNCVSLQICNLS